MANEQERKWVVDDLPDDLEDGKRMRQVYLAVTETKEIRVRIWTEGSFTYYEMGMKKGKGENREEYHTFLYPSQFEDLEEAIEGEVTKTRYEIPHGDLLMELDVYEDTTLPCGGKAVVEIEDCLADFDEPEWFGKEVTEDERYKNKWLAVS